MTEIRCYHAHVYYDEQTHEQAVAFFAAAAEKFSITLGKFHRQPVGPHALWNSAFSFPKEMFGELVPWLAINRNGLSVLVHCLTGDDYQDHNEHAIWMGKVEPLNLEIFLK